MSAQAIAFLSFPIQIPEPMDWKNLTDEELVVIYRETGGLCAREDAAAELFQRHQARVARWCYRFTRDRESAADLAQEILLRAFRNVNKYRGECRFSTWLYVITRNLCMSAIQKRSNEPVWVAKTLAAELPDRATVDVHAEIESEETRRKSWRFILDTLDQTEARVMLLHYGQEMPLNAVSRKLGLTNKSGAKAYVVSARRKLNAALRKTAEERPLAVARGSGGQKPSRERECAA